MEWFDALPNAGTRLLNTLFRTNRCLINGLATFFCCSAGFSYAAAERPPTLSNSKVIKQEISFREQQVQTIQLAQAAGEATLITLHSRGVVFNLELANGKQRNQPESYQELDLLQTQLFITSDDCLDCRIRITTELPQAFDTQFTITTTTYQAQATERISSERALSNYLGSNVHQRDGKQLLAAIQFLNQQASVEDQLRGCYHSLDPELINSAATIAVRIPNCRVLAQRAERPFVGDKLKLQQIRVGLWFVDKNQQAIAGTQTLIAELMRPERAIQDRLAQQYLLGRSHLLLGMMTAKLGDYSQAEEYLRIAEKHFQAIGNHYDLAEALSELGTTLRFRNQIAEAAGQFEKAYSASSTSIRSYPDQLLRIRYNMSGVSMLGGQYYYALKLIEPVDIATLPMAPTWRGHFYALRARILLELGRLDEARDFYLQAWAIYDNEQASSHLATVSRDLSRLYTQQGDFKQAKHYLALASEHLGHSWGEAQKIRVLQAEIDFLLQNQQAEAALAVVAEVEKSLADQSDPFLRGRVESQKGEALIMAGDYQQAYTTLGRALSRHHTSKDTLYTTRSNYLAAKAAFQLSDSAAVVHHLAEAKAVIESVRDEIEDEQIRQQYFALQKSIYELSIAAELSTADAGRELAALYESESFRARTLYENLVNAPGNNNAQQSGQQSLESLLQESFVLAQHQPVGKHRWPKFTQSELTKFLAELNPDEAYLYFFAGESHSYGWFITQQSTYLYPLPSGKSLAETVMPLLKLINQNPASAQNPRLWQNLFNENRATSNTILAPIANQLGSIKHLTVIPDGIIHQLPFAVLLDPNSGYRQPLINNLDISYASSLATAHWLKYEQNSTITDANLLLVANPALGDGDTQPIIANIRSGWGDLPAAEQEAKMLQTLWSQVGNSDVLYGAAATKSALLTSPLQNYQIIHFASHAQVNWDNPALSAIKLAPTQNDTPYGSPDLTLAEIARLNIRAQLVVLSACETAAGRQTSGEGPIGLSRAFFEAGANRVLASLWPVDDRATAKLLELFYEGLIDQRLAPSRALRQAQQAMLQTGEFAHPYFWSGFLFIGNTAPWLLQAQATDRQQLTFR
ncbi:CHAT domain-containing tetratricopeptide repeat protein [Halioxenophilus sp. WMMB6]|uniref:CHAT domain-containing protein n=1 Tax=Halioxenophilus sp. WMMB6 TaxID=3073815 RepID=UPI00295F00A8|nr:CHAT domain-containing tetratricopeptide repeat protein [Halioxenophilus sp. WMMB6]